MRKTALLLLAALCFCSAAGAAPSPAPQRIISLSPSFTEILFALGAGSRVVGTTTYCDFPPEAQKTAKIGDMMNPNVERMIALHPDIVFAGNWKWEVPEKLRKAGIRVVEVRDAESLKDSMDRVLFIGSETGTEPQAQQIVASMKARIDAIRRRSGQAGKPGVFVELDTGLWTVGGKSYINEVLETLGLENIFRDRTEPYLMVTMESIVAREPDLLISMCRPAQEYKESPAWSTVKAVREGRIIDQKALDWNAITHQGPRLVDGMEALEKLIVERQGKP